MSEPKRRKSALPSKKKSVVEKTDENNQGLEDFKIDLIGEIEPARKTKTAEKKTTEPKQRTTRAAKQKTEETEKIIDADEAKPRERSAAKKETTGDSVSKPAKKISAKSAKKKMPETVSVSNDESPVAEAQVQTKILPQSETSSQPKMISSKQTKTTEPEKVETAENLTKDPLAEKSPVFRELAAPKLPDLQPENRAWLQMQSPTRIFLYWSLKTNPFETLQKVFGGKNAGYALSVKLQNLNDNTEKTYPLAPYGSAWFDVESDAKYRAAVGLFAASRPFIRLVFSNTIETPRLAPSPRLDWLPQFAVNSERFAEVLDVSGYKQDAFEIALAGDDLEAGNRATFNAFEQLTGESDLGIKASELRLVLFALASKVALDDLRGQISTKLFAYLEKLTEKNAARLSSEKILAALEENFGLESLETEDEQGEISYSAVGASLINFKIFPKKFWKKFMPVSSLRVGR